MVVEYLDKHLTQVQKDYINWSDKTTQAMLAQLDRAVVAGHNSISLPYWAEKDPKLVKDFTYAMVKLGYGTTVVRNNFASFTFNSKLLDQDRLTDYRIQQKLQKYVLRLDTEDYGADLVKVGKDYVKTGLVRNGFAKAAKRPFSFDTAKLREYLPYIRRNLVKSIEIAYNKAVAKGKASKFDTFLADPANYVAIADYVINEYLLGLEYNLEQNISDQRGRAIYKALKRIGNPISSKDFRALLLVPRQQAVAISIHNKPALDDIYYFIAELAGTKAKSYKSKIAVGRRYYTTRKLPSIDFNSLESLKDLHELIWLERIYAQLDVLFAKGVCVWRIPLEVDASMSIAQIVGALTNDKRLLESTNVIGDTLSDPWHIKDVRRLTAKSIGTPVFYGSSQSAISLIKAKGISVNKDELRLVRKEFSSGRFAVMKAFKDALISNYNNHKPVIHIKIWNDSFDVHVNKFKCAGSKVQVTEAFDGKAFKYAYTHIPLLVPDYKRMKLFWATCLV